MIVFTSAKIAATTSRVSTNCRVSAGRERDDRDLQRGDQGHDPDREGVDDDTDEEAHSRDPVCTTGDGCRSGRLLDSQGDRRPRADPRPHPPRDRRAAAVQAGQAGRRRRVQAVQQREPVRSAAGGARGACTRATAAQPLSRTPRPPACGIASAERFGVDRRPVHIAAGSVSILAPARARDGSGPGDEVIYAWRSFEAYPGLAARRRRAPASRCRSPTDARHDLAGDGRGHHRPHARDHRVQPRTTRPARSSRRPSSTRSSRASRATC